MPVDADRTGQRAFAERTGMDIESYIEEGPADSRSGDGDNVPISADIPEGLIDDLADAANKLAFGDFEGRSELELFNSQYTQVKQWVAREQGLTASALLNRYEDLVKAAALYISDEQNDSFGGKIASGDQFLVKAIDTETFSDNTNGTGPNMTAADRVFNTAGTTAADGTNAFGIVPRRATGSVTDSDAYGTLTGQILVITHYYETTNGRVIEAVQETVSTDNFGERMPTGVYENVNEGNVGIIPRDGALVVDHDSELYNALGRAASNADTDILPGGVEITTANNIANLTA